MNLANCLIYILEHVQFDYLKTYTLLILRNIKLYQVVIKTANVKVIITISYVGTSNLLKLYLRGYIFSGQ